MAEGHSTVFETEREREREKEGGREEPLRRSNALSLSLFLEGKKSFRERCVVSSKRRILEELFVMYNYRRVRNHLEITGWSLDFFLSVCVSEIQSVRVSCIGLMIDG